MEVFKYMKTEVDCFMEQSDVAEKHQMALNPEQKHRKYELMQDKEMIYEYFLGVVV